MVVQAGVQHGFGDIATLFEHVKAFHRVAADHGEFLVCELARLVEHLQGNGGLAQVMHQTGQTGQPLLVFLELELFGQGDHERAHRHRMHIGVIVRRFQAGQADQRTRIAGHGIGDFLYQALQSHRIHRAAHARLIEHGDHCLL